MIISPEQTIGNIVKMRTSNPLHFTGERDMTVEDSAPLSFADSLKKAMGSVNNLLQDSDGLYQQMIYDPDSVDIHTVMIAAQKAEIALNFTKAIRDEAIRSYRDLMNLR